MLLTAPLGSMRAALSRRLRPDGSSSATVRNVLWSLAGTGLPLIVAAASIPSLIAALGTTRFGVLSLAWIVVGYFSLFDLGLGRAITQLVAQKIGSGEESEVPSVVWIGMSLMIALGIVGGLVVAALSPWLVNSKLEIPPPLRAETLTAFYLLAASIPVVIMTAATRGVLEARHRFDVVNIVRAPLGALTYLGPLAVLPFSHELPPMVGALVAVRVLTCAVYLVACLRLYPELARKAPFNRDLLRQMLSFGGWMTLSNVAAPLLLYIGRLALAVMVSAEAVAFFSTPYDVVINLLIIPGVFVSVLFPMFAQQIAADKPAVRKLYRQSLIAMAVVMLPLTVLTFVAARPALAWWINPVFSENGFRVAQLLAIGIFINSFGHLSQALVQAHGRPDLTAKLHVVELVVHIPYLFWLISHHGVVGAAIAWVIRVTLSTIVLGTMASRCLAGSISNAR